MARPKNSFFDKDSGYQTIMTSFKSATNRAVFIGFLRSSGEYKPKDGEGPKEPITVAQVAAIQEFGATNKNAWGLGIKTVIPPRPFMSKSVDDNKSKINKMIDKLMGKVVDGGQTEVGALRILGAFVQGLMRSKLLTGPWAPNSPTTIALKGAGKKPLVDTSQMVKAIDFEVIDAKGKSGGSA